MISKYPDTQYLEEIKLTILKSYFYLASNSVVSKKKQRFDEGIEAYYDFIDNFADGKSIEEAKLVYAKLIREQERFLAEKQSKDEL